jgi:hypothetical protein
MIYAYQRAMAPSNISPFVNLLKNPVFSQPSKPGFFPTGFLNQLLQASIPKKPGFLKKPGFCWANKPIEETRFFPNRVSGPH